MVTMGDFMDYLEWRKHNKGTKSNEVVSAISPEPMVPMIRFYNDGNQLFVISRRSRMYRLLYKRHNERPLYKIPGVPQEYKSVILVMSLVTFGLVGLKNDSTGTVQWMTIPEGVVHSVYPYFLITRKAFVSRVKNVLKTR